MQRYNIPNNNTPRTPLTPDEHEQDVPDSWGATDADLVQPSRAQKPGPQKKSAPQQKKEKEPVVRSMTIDTPAVQEKGSTKLNPKKPEAHHDSVRFVRGVINEGIRRGASDIHFEPQTDMYRIRFRVDGVLREFTERPYEEYLTMLNAVKVLSDMDIAEHILPQDGHLELVLQQIDQDSSESEDEQHSGDGEQFFDIRVSVFPSVNGEVIVMRILNRASALRSIEELGMESESFKQLQQILLNAYGMILVTGPTGSGKTTTLYSVLQELKSEEKNIMTLEDPIEFHLHWMRQCEMRAEQGFTFERAMSSILRQDPDVLMIGEIRDPKTAEYAVRSALVGRIVGSTIHANTAVGTIARLLDLGIPRSTLAHSVHGIIAQRLVRKICSNCKEEYEPGRLALTHFGLQDSPGPFYRGRGCQQCGNSGFKGRTGLFSVMKFDDDLRSMIFEVRPLLDIQERAIELGMRTLKMNAAVMILAGTTTAEEAARSV